MVGLVTEEDAGEEVLCQEADEQVGRPVPAPDKAHKQHPHLEQPAGGGLWILEICPCFTQRACGARACSAIL